MTVRFECPWTEGRSQHTLAHYFLLKAQRRSNECHHTFAELSAPQMSARKTRFVQNHTHLVERRVPFRQSILGAVDIIVHNQNGRCMAQWSD